MLKIVCNKVLIMVINSGIKYDRLYRVKTFLDNTIKVRATSILQYTVLWRQSGIMLRSVLPISDF